MLLQSTVVIFSHSIQSSYGYFVKIRLGKISYVQKTARVRAVK